MSDSKYDCVVVFGTSNGLCEMRIKDVAEIQTEEGGILTLLDDEGSSLAAFRSWEHFYVDKEY